LLNDFIKLLWYSFCTIIF